MADRRKRFRVTVPEGDKDVLAWLKAQENIGMSIRQLIKIDCLNNGVTDVMCRSLRSVAGLYPAGPAEAPVTVAVQASPAAIPEGAPATVQAVMPPAEEKKEEAAEAAHDGGTGGPVPAKSVMTFFG